MVNSRFTCLIIVKWTLFTPKITSSHAKFHLFFWCTYSYVIPIFQAGFFLVQYGHLWQEHLDKLFDLHSTGKLKVIHMHLIQDFCIVRNSVISIFFLYVLVWEQLLVTTTSFKLERASLNRPSVSIVNNSQFSLN